MLKFDYKIIIVYDSHRTEDLERDLKAFGAEGWELIVRHYAALIFKRVIDA
jgi:hypothetical protein